MNQRLVVDGSNLAHHRRQKNPSLAQLLACLDALSAWCPEAQITLVVDANFGYRIDEHEVARFKREAQERPILQPPSGTVGRGDALVCAIAEMLVKSGEQVVVVSNDAYAEHQAAHPWLLDEGRVLGATLVPEVGWAFLPRRFGRGLDPTGARPTLAPPAESPEQAADVGWDEPLRDWESEMLSAEPAESASAPEPEAPSQPAQKRNVWYEAGQVVEGTATWVAEYGAFVALSRGGKGRVHKSELAEDIVSDAREAIGRGERLFVMVQGRNEKGHYRLSRKSADAKAREDFDPSAYFAEFSYDEEGNYIYPAGYDPVAGEWLPDFEEERKAWWGQYREAHAAWERHREMLGLEGQFPPPGDDPEEPGPTP